MPKQKIIGSVVCDPPVAKAGESVRVTVRNPQGRAYRNTESSSITINGVPGSEQWMRWTSPGARVIHVMASDEGSDEIETSRLEIDVVGKDGPSRPYLKVESTPERPTTATFTVVDPTRATHVPVHRGPRLTEPPKRRQLRRAIGPVGPGVQAAPPKYTWRMGDGKSLVVPRDNIEHDFGPHLDPKRVRQTFNVEVVAELPNRPPVVLHHTVSVLNTYGLMRRRGVLRPPVSCDRVARFEDGRFTGRMRVRNPETFQLRLTKRRVEVFYDGDRDSRIVAEEVAGVSLPPGQLVDVDVKVPATSLVGAVGFAVHFAGRPAKAETRHTVRLSAYFDVVGRRKGTVIEGSLATFIGHVAGTNLGRATTFPVRDLERLIRRGVVDPPAIGATAAVPGSLARLADRSRPAWGDPGSTPVGKHLDEPPAAVGARCNPENLPDQIPEGFVCQATPEKRWELLPGRFVNARKGDIVLSPGDNGYIGQLLRQVSPPQNYSHSGIMTRNHDEITHSTAAPERLEDQASGGGAPTDGFEPHALRYLWPGAITQTVNAATEGELLESPDNGSPTYLIQSFNPDVSGDVTELIPALVVKPDPFLETPELRAKLEAVAAKAVAEVGKTHYSFYGYTNPAAALDGEHDAPDSPYAPGWPALTYPSVCSSFIWLCYRNFVDMVEGDLEAADTLAGGDDGGADGLYRYTAHERREAGEWLRGTLYNRLKQAANEKGWFGQLTAEVSDMADDVANQILNTFSSNWAETDSKDSEKWRDQFDAFAVSPDNILLWDGPDSKVGGLYGHAEELMYRPEHLEEVVVHRWAFVETRGTVSGTAHLGDAGQGGVRIELTENLFVMTGADGFFSLPDVPSGSYVLKAYKVTDDQVPLKATIPIKVVADQTTVVDVALTLPDKQFREVVLNARMEIVDDEFAAAVDPHVVLSFEGVLHVGPGSTHDVTTFTGICDESVMAELRLAADLEPDGSVTITARGRIYESEDPYDGIGGEVEVSFPVPPGAIRTWDGMKLVNDDDDSVVLDFDVLNSQDKF
jgi:hypothetical protein